MDRAAAPLRAAQLAAEAYTAPIREAAAAHEKMLAPIRQFERQQRAIYASIDSGLGRYLREIVGVPARAEAAVIPAHTSPAPTRAPAPIAVTPTSPSAPTAAAIHPRLVIDTSPEAMSALVERVAEAVVRRLAAPPSPDPGTKAAPVTGRRGRRRREISVGGVDAALEALAEEDQSVRALAARALVDRGVPYGRRTIEKCDTYKAWRRDLKAIRMEAAADGMADVLDAGLVRIRKKKPGRGRLVDPTIDPAVEKMTKEFLRLHGEEGLDGQ